MTGDKKKNLEMRGGFRGERREGIISAFFLSFVVVN
jgi:hypothetical protein